MRKLISLLMCLCLSIGLVSAQTVKCSGVVISAEDGEPVIGAAVLVKGTSLGTITDLDGKFNLSDIPVGHKLISVSFIGMQTAEVAIKDGVKITLSSSSQELDEVMVVAYGTAKKASFTGSASTLSAKSVEKLQVSNVSKALEGAAPGVQVAMESGQPGAGATIRVRGIGSINASADPLIVVDGMPYNGNLSSINPSDIESMSVLKDAASTSLYGSRAANGVIIISTKKGSNQKSRVTVNARLGVNSRGVSEYDIMKDPGMYMTTYWNVLKNMNKGDGAAASEQLFSKVGYNPYATANDMIVDADGNLTSAKLLYNDDWEKEAISTGMRQEYSIGVQGGSDKSKHFLSLGYLEDEGIISNSDFQRFSARASGDYTVNKFVKLNGNVSYSRGEQNSQAISSLSNMTNTFMFTQYIAPIYPIYAYDKDGNRLYNEDGSNLYDFGNGEYGNRAWGSNQNVVASDAANKNQVVSDNLATRFGLDLSFLKDFKFQANIGYDLTNTMQNRFQTPSFGDAAASNGRSYKYRMRTETLTLNQLLSYNKSVNNHNIDVLVGHESYSYLYNYLAGTKTNVFDPENTEFNNAITIEDLNSYQNDYAIESYFGRINYDYASKYYISGSVRRDGSSRFAKDNRWGTFWSVGGSWRVSEEEFMKSASFIDNMTLRASYGSVGNDDIYYPGTTTSNYYAYKTQYIVANSDGDFSLTKYYLGNPDLTWETSYNANVGLSASLFDNLLNLDIEYFNKRTVDMLYNVPQSPSSGDTYKSENALTMVNKGVEFSLNVNVPLSRNDMRWSWNFTGTHYKNKVTDIPANKKEAGITHSSYYNIKEGKSVYDFFSYKYAGLNENGQSTWYVDTTDSEGNTVQSTTTDYTSATKYYIGNALPDFQGGITTEFSWKGFDLSIGTNYQIGGKIYDSMYASLMHAGSDAGRNWHKDILNAWTPDNTNSNIPVLNGNQNANTFSDRFLIDASYFNIRNITFGYTLPKSWLSKAEIENARIYMTGDNLAVFSKRKGMDPRQYISGQSQANYSAVRTISVGLSLTL